MRHDIPTLGVVKLTDSRTLFYLPNSGSARQIAKR
jgi:hypothetical protein